MFHNLCMSLHLTSLGPRYSLLDENNLLLDKGAPLLESCLNSTLVTPVESSDACPPWNHHQDGAFMCMILGGCIHLCMFFLLMTT